MMWLGTPAGTPVPPSGVMYRQSGPQAQQVAYEAAPGSLVVEVFHHSKYIVDPAWAPPADPPRVVAMRRVKHDWTCSHTNAAAIQLDQPGANRQQKVQELAERKDQLEARVGELETQMDRTAGELAAFDAEIDAADLKKARRGARA